MFRLLRAVGPRVAGARDGSAKCVSRSFSTSAITSRVMSGSNVNKNVIDAEYAVRGKIPLRATELKQELKDGISHPFDEVIDANIGNPQSLRQKPITFIRQVLALIDYPELIDSPQAAVLFKQDAIERAKLYMDNGVNVGAYSHSLGVSYLRQEVANYINERDGSNVSHQQIMMCSGASEGIANLMQLMISNNKVGIMIPKPQYPLYSASVTLCGGAEMYYDLSEDQGWDLSVDSLRASIATQRSAGMDVRGLVVINPGNPTGTCLELSSMQQIIEVCAEENLVLLADEVYQTNVYNPEERPFHSFAKVLADSKYKDSLELASFHSVSKGMIGECGRRGGYMHIVNFDKEVEKLLEKRFSINLCSNVAGQIVTALMCNPPKEGDASYNEYKEEYDSIFKSLSWRQMQLQEAFYKMEGISCRRESRSSMYLFPKITLSAKAQAAAREAAIKEAELSGKEFDEKKVKADEFYCLKLLEATGLCVVPGSGFMQADGTFHFRTTFLPPEDQFGPFIERFERFHKEFMAEYA